MITLHTLENVYDEDHNYHQFVQRGQQHLLDSQALDGLGTLRAFLECDVIGAIDDADDRTQSLLLRVLETGDINKLLEYAMRVRMRGSKCDHVCQTRFGEWTFESVVIEPPTLRELQDDLRASDEQFPRSDWQLEAFNGDTHIGYWEWVEHMREAQ